MTTDDAEMQEAREWYVRKSALMEQSLGKEHDIVMHAIIPYSIGGALDLYYYPHGISGTAIATKELCETLDGCPQNDDYDCYELVMFTRHPLDLDAADNEKTPFGKAHHSITAFLNCIAQYSTQASLNAGETCEFPAEMETVGGRYLLFDGYASRHDDRAQNFGLLVLVEIFCSEMEFARENGGAKLIERLKTSGCYPYSDLDRKPVA